MRGSDAVFYSRRMPHLWYAGIRVMKHANKLTCVTPCIKEKMMQAWQHHGVKEIINKADVVNNGIDAIWLDNLSVEQREMNNPIKVLYIGRFDSNKNVYRLIKAITALREKYDVRLTIVGGVGGNDEEHEIVMKEVDGHKDYIEYLGAIYDKEKLIQVVRQSDIFAMASHSETFGLVYVECLTQGLPILYSNGPAFHVNVDAAYIKKANDEFQVIPLLFAGSEVKPGEIMVSDAAGNALASATSVPRVAEKHKVTVTAGTSVQNDNGQTLTNTEAIVSDGSLMKGHRMEATFNGSQTGPGESVNEITDIHIYDSNGREATAYYDVTLKKGKLILVDSKESAADDNSTGSAVTRILVRDENETTISNSQHALGSGRDDNDSIKTGTATASFKKMSYSDKTVKDGQLDSDKKAFADGQVLGARRADTGDYTVNAGARLALIVLCLMLISIIEIKRNKTK